MFFRFLGSDNKDTFFTETQRSRILWEILSTAIFGKKKKGEIGIGRLVDEGVFLSAFPLHTVNKLKSVTSCISSLPEINESVKNFLWNTRFLMFPLDCQIMQLSQNDVAI